MTQLWRRTVILTLLGALALGAVALVGFWHPNMPTDAITSFVPKVTLPAVMLGGLADGINPCAFTVLLLFVTAMLSASQASGQTGLALRAKLLGMGSIYVGTMFLTYLGLGVGILSSIKVVAWQHLPARIAALIAILMGLWMVKDYFLPNLGLRLQAPARISEVARKAARAATVPALVASGFLIGLCTVPCSGAVYLGILSLLALQTTELAGYGYLVLYNLFFILPLVGVLLAASARPTLNKLAHWNLHHKEWVRLALGSVVVVMGLVILATL